MLGFLSMLRPFMRYIAPGLIILIIIGTIWYKFNNYKTIIVNQEITINTYSNKIRELELLREFDKNNIKQLSESIDKTNEQIERIKVDNQKLELEVKYWKERPPEVVEKVIRQYVPVKQKVTGEECLKTINNLNNLKYKDL